MEHTSTLEPSNTVQELFALTDEQILGIEPQGELPNREVVSSESAPDRTLTQPEAIENKAPDAQSTEPPPPPWLAERMNDPWHGEAARELWESAQKAQQEAGAYRELFATPADARALKDLYPGGVAEAKTAADRSRQLEEIDAAYFGSATNAPEERSSGRTQLAQKLMDQDPAAFREMVLAGVELLERAKATPRATLPAHSVASALEASGPADPQLARSYADFEKSANADLERSVGATIARTIEQALPNLSRLSASQQSAGLSERLIASVKQEIDVALKSDAQLGEQVAKILSSSRFDASARAQVVRLIDARAQQLVPGAVRRVVGSWTQTSLAARQGTAPRVENNSQSTLADMPQRTPAAQKPAQTKEKPATNQQVASNRRPNYKDLTDEQILNL